MTTLVTCDSKDQLVAYLYDEAPPPEREAFEAHLVGCERCRQELQALGGVRETLGAWEAPALPSHVRVVTGRRAASPHRRWWIAAPLAAAAVLVLAAAAGLANLEIRRGADGWTLRTGWGSAPAAARGAVASPAPVDTATAGADDAAWRPALVALERQLRAEFSSSRPASPVAARGPTLPPAAGPQSTRVAEQDLLRRVQQMIDESEVRQQRNLALRMAEVSHDLSLQRQADLVQIQQGFGRLEGRTEVEAARQRELMNYIMRVSQPPQPR